jgi:hypothetical protein
LSDLQSAGGEEEEKGSVSLQVEELRRRLEAAELAKAARLKRDRLAREAKRMSEERDRLLKEVARAEAEIEGSSTPPQNPDSFKFEFPGDSPSDSSSSDEEASAKRRREDKKRKKESARLRRVLEEKYADPVPKSKPQEAENRTDLLDRRLLDELRTTLDPAQAELLKKLVDSRATTHRVSSSSPARSESSSFSVFPPPPSELDQDLRSKLSTAADPKAVMAAPELTRHLWMETQVRGVAKIQRDAIFKGTASLRQFYDFLKKWKLIGLTPFGRAGSLLMDQAVAIMSEFYGLKEPWAPVRVYMRSLLQAAGLSDSLASDKSVHDYILKGYERLAVAPDKTNIMFSLDPHAKEAMLMAATRDNWSRERDVSSKQDTGKQDDGPKQPDGSKKKKKKKKGKKGKSSTQQSPPQTNGGSEEASSGRD